VAPSTVAASPSSTKPVQSVLVYVVDQLSVGASTETITVTIGDQSERVVASSNNPVGNLALEVSSSEDTLFYTLNAEVIYPDRQESAVGTGRIDMADGAYYVKTKPDGRPALASPPGAGSSAITVMDSWAADIKWERVTVRINGMSDLLEVRKATPTDTVYFGVSPGTYSYRLNGKFRLASDGEVYNFDGSGEVEVVGLGQEFYLDYSETGGFHGELKVLN